MEQRFRTVEQRYRVEQRFSAAINAFLMIGF
jgi:hypothetical protein